VEVEEEEEEEELWLREIQTSPGVSWLHGRLYLAMERWGEQEDQPRPNTKNGCSRPADTDT